MKNQYFGDIRDLFKYDLILKVIQDIDLIHQLLFIPMLTENDKSTEGNKTNHSKAKAGTLNDELIAYLRSCVDNNRRNISEIEKYYKSKGINLFLYQQPFTCKTRNVYFNEIKARGELFCNSLVFVDPDIGMEIKKPTEKHILYNEIKGLYEFMNANSVLMIFQYIPYLKNRKEYRNTRTEELKSILQTSPVYISSNDVIFFFLAKDYQIRNQIEITIKKYNSKYSALKTAL